MSDWELLLLSVMQSLVVHLTCAESRMRTRPATTCRMKLTKGVPENLGVARAR